MKSAIYFLITSFLFLLSPTFSLAASTLDQCSSNGYTVATINGILTDDTGAKENKESLQRILPNTHHNETLKVDFLPNPPHLGGLGDILKSAYQGLFDSETVTDYDLVEMLKAASEKVRTQKILLVAHSQGNFYANSFYDTVAGKDGGVPPESIGVYSVATPSSRVAGSGMWLTSDTDQVIAGLVGRRLARNIMAPNTHIALAPEDESLGHNFSTVYLKYRGSQIISDIETSLDRLQTNTIQDLQKPCLAPPKLTIGHKIVGATFAVADPIANASDGVIAAAAMGIYRAGATTAQFAGSIYHVIGMTLAERIAAFQHISFAAASVLYGSSVTVKDIEEPQAPATDLVAKLVTSQAPTTAVPVKKVTPRITEDMSPAIPQSSILPPTETPKVISEQKSGTNKTQALPPSDETARSHGNVPDEVIALAHAQVSSSETSSAVAATTTEPAVTTDTTAPSVSLTISECADSFSPSACLIATTTITLAWESTASDLAWYAVSCVSAGAPCAGFSSATTSATGTLYAIPADNADYIFSIVAYDTSGNASVSAEATVAVATRPVVINEIAWAGTSATRSSDEWIELYNPTAHAVSLSGWILYSATNNDPYIALAGSIPSKGFFLLERTSSTTISDIIEDQTYTGSLSNSGEQLILSRASTTIDQTPEISACSGWCGGYAVVYRTMERIDHADDGSQTSNWTASGVLANGANADGIAIGGTPKKRNSIDYVPPVIRAGAHVVLTISKSPYVISGEYIVPSSATLEIEPGVVLKFDTDSSLKVNGALSAEGTSGEPIVFTSLHDDDCGITGGCGDTNGTTTLASAGNWKSIYIASPTASSVISHAIVRYGGAIAPFGDYATNIWIKNSDTIIRDSTIEYSEAYGIKVDGAGGGTIASNVIRENGMAGLYIYVTSNLAVESNTFTGNSTAALDVLSSYPTFSGNTADGNGINGIQMKLVLDRDYTFTANLPYYMIEDAIIMPGNTLTISAGTILKFDPGTTFTVRGTLIANGTSVAPIIFTSLYDDDCGITGGCGDTNGDGSASTPVAGDWQNITFVQNLATSTLSYVRARYGGLTQAFSPRGVLRATHASIALDHAVIEKNYIVGISLSYSTSTAISDTTIQDHQGGATGTFYGLHLSNSSTPSIANTQFSLNDEHIFWDGTSTTTDLGGNVWE